MFSAVYIHVYTTNRMDPKYGSISNSSKVKGHTIFQKEFYKLKWNIGFQRLAVNL